MNVINLEGVKWFIENYVSHKITDCYRNPRLCEELNSVSKDLKDIIALCRKMLNEIDEIIKIRKGVTELTTTEYIAIALAQRPNAPESVRRKAQEIIYKYRLTPEQVRAIYESVYGKT